MTKPAQGAITSLVKNPARPAERTLPRAGARRTAAGHNTPLLPEVTLPAAPHAAPRLGMLAVV